MSIYFPKPFIWHFGKSINVKVNLPNYAKKSDLKNATHVNTSSFALKTLDNLKTEDDQLDIDKSLPVLDHLHKLSDIVKNDVVKKTAYGKLVAKLNNINTSNFVLETSYNTELIERIDNSKQN